MTGDRTSTDAQRESLGIVIPAYNEQDRLPATLDATLAFLRASGHPFEVAVVNDGSRDRTAELVREYSKAEPRVRLLEYGGNRGKGYAVRFGMTKVSGQIRLFMDADNSTTVDQIGDFLPYFREGQDAVIGSRYIEGANVEIHQHRLKEALGAMGNMWIRFWAVPGIRDTQAGFKAFTAEAAMDVFPRLTIDRWGFDVELLAVTRRLGYRIKERPIRWRNDFRSHVSASAYLQVLREVVQVRWNLWTGKYQSPPVVAREAGTSDEV